MLYYFRHVNTASKSLLTLFDDAASAHLNSQPETLNDHLNRYFASLQRSPGASTPMQKSKDRYVVFLAVKISY